MDADEHRCLNNVTKMVIGASFEVANVLGTGFLEKVYEKALAVELRRRGLVVEEQKPLSVSYKGDVVGEYFADLLVEHRVIVELKYVDAFASEHIAQCLNYLKAAGLHVALLINFKHPRIDYKRIVHDF